MLDMKELTNMDYFVLIVLFMAVAGMIGVIFSGIVSYTASFILLWLIFVALMFADYLLYKIWSEVSKK